MVSFGRAFGCSVINYSQGARQPILWKEQSGSREENAVASCNCGISEQNIGVLSFCLLLRFFKFAEWDSGAAF